MSDEILPPPPNYVSFGAHLSDEVHGKFIAYLKTMARDTIIGDILTLSGISGI